MKHSPNLATTLATTAQPSMRDLMTAAAIAVQRAQDAREGGEGGVGVLARGGGGDPSHPPERVLDPKGWFAERPLADALGVPQEALKNARPALVEGADWERQGPGGAVVYRERAVRTLVYCLGLEDEDGTSTVDLPAVLDAARVTVSPEASPLLPATVQRLPISAAHVYVRLPDRRVILARVNKKRRPELRAGSAVSVRLEAGGKLANVIFEGGRPKKRRVAIAGQSGQRKAGDITARPAARPLNF